MVWEMSFEEFQDEPHGSHLGCWNRTNLTAVNFHVSIMPPNKFQLNLTYRSRADVVLRFSSWRILEWNQFSNSKSPSYPNASHQGRTQSNLPFGSRHGLKILAILNLYVAPIPHIKFQLNPTYGLGGDVVKRFSR